MSDEERAAEILAAWRERIERGETLDPDEAVREHPDLERQLRRGLALMAVLAGAPQLAAAPAAPLPDVTGRFGPYVLLREIGRGGQAVVWLGEDTRLLRRVALKVFAPSAAPTENQTERFRREATAAARLDHPGICAVYEAGVVDRTPYIAMRHVEGRPLSRWITDAREAAERTSSVDLPDREPSSDRRGAVAKVVRFVEQTARALHVAHEAGLIHRDVKPGNLMVTPAGDPVILDFGLARDEDGDASLTATGALLGTPAYMSPEQLAVPPVGLDRRTDVYSLGVTLYECLTLRVPFEGPSRETLYRRILTREPLRVRRLNRDVPRDLEIVLEAAMERNRDRRYSTALDFAEDLRRIREHAPVRARRAPALLRVWRWAQRAPAVATAVCALVVAGAIAAWLIHQQASRDRESSARALAAREDRAQRLVEASRDLLQTDSTAALLLAREAVRVHAGPQVLQQLRAVLARTRQRVGVQAHESQVNSIAFSPAADLVATASVDGTARLWTREGRPVALLAGHEGHVMQVRFSPDGRRVVTASTDATARVWDVPSGRAAAVIRGHTDKVACATFSSDGNRLLTGSWDGTACVWRVAASGEVTETLRVRHQRPVFAALFTPDATRIVTASFDRTGRVWDAATGAERAVLRGHRAALRDLDVSPRGDRLVTAGHDDTARVFDLEGRALATISDGGLSGAMFSLDGERIATMARGSPRLWLSSGQHIAQLGGSGTTPQLCWLPDGHRFVTPVQGALRVWTSEGSLEDVLPLSAGSVHAVCAASTGAWIASGSFDGKLEIWDLASGADPGESATAEALIARADSLAFRDLSRDERERFSDLLGPENRTVLEAYRLVDRAEKRPDVVLVSELVTAVRSDPDATEAVRSAAAEIASRRHEATWGLAAAALNVVKRPGRTAADYALALRRSEVAARYHSSDAGSIQGALGAALFRTGQYERAVAVLERNDRIEELGRGAGVVEDAIFLAMARYRLGDRPEALRQLARARAADKRPHRDLHPPDVEALFQEADALIGKD